MKNYYRYSLLFITSFLITGCSFMRGGSSSYKDNSSSSDSDNTSSSSSSSSSSSIEDKEPIDDNPALINSEEYLTFWNPSTKLNIEVTMSEKAAQFIDNYQSNHNDSTYFDFYVPCTFKLTMNETVYIFEEVGIREKGNMSRTRILNNNHFSLNTLAHYKFSFKETFDDEEYDTISILQPFKKNWDDEADKKARKKRTLFDMEKIDIKWNRNNDESKSKQSYGLKLFRDQGVLCGNDTLAKVSMGINGDTPITTTYEILECLDSVFIKRHFNAEYADGDLYKCTYTEMGPANFSSSYAVGNQIGVEDNYNRYHPVYDLKTNKKKNTTHTNLLNLFNIINDKSSSSSSYEQKVEQYIDMNSFMMMESIAYLIGNYDDMRNNANNYYLYFTSTTNMAYFIPYDFDRAFGMGTDGRQDYMTNFSPESTKMQCSGSWQTINLYWRTICSSTDSSSNHSSVTRIEKYRALYQKNIEDLLNNKIVSTESFTSFVNSFPNEYRGNANGSGSGNISFANYLTKKIQAIKSNTSNGLINYDIKV